MDVTQVARLDAGLRGRPPKRFWKRQFGLIQLGEFAIQRADSLPNPVVFRALGWCQTPKGLGLHQFDLALEEPVDLFGDLPDPTKVR